jgi:hypothetical protein
VVWWVRYFRKLMVDGFRVAHTHGETVLTLMEIMNFQSKFPAFVKMGPAAINGFKNRLMVGATLTDPQLERVVDNLIGYGPTRVHYLSIVSRPVCHCIQYVLAGREGIAEGLVAWCGVARRAYGACGTGLYDQFQLLQNGILP